MKIVILCGGKGTRFREETEFKPKPLVLVGRMPLLWHIMKIYSHYGYKDFILCLGYKGEMIKDYFLKFEELMHDFTLRLRHNERITHHAPEKLEDWNITFMDTGLETMTGARVAQVKKYIGDDEDFFLTYGDGLAKIDISDLYRFHKSKGKTVTVTAIHLPTTYGVLDVADGHARSFTEKPPLAERVSGGFFVCNRRVFDYLSAHKDCVFEKEMQRISRDGELAAYEHNDFWFGVNTHREWEQINQMEAEGKTPWKVWEQAP